MRLGVYHHKVNIKTYNYTQKPFLSSILAVLKILDKLHAAQIIGIDIWTSSLTSSLDALSEEIVLES